MIQAATFFLLLVTTTFALADDVTVEVGKRAPDFTATALDGTRFKLTDKFQDGKKNVALMFSRAHW